MKCERHSASTEDNTEFNPAVSWCGLNIPIYALGFLFFFPGVIIAPPQLLLFMQNPSIETLLIVELAYRSPPLLIYITSALFHDVLDTFHRQMSPLNVIREMSVLQSNH